MSNLKLPNMSRESLLATLSSKDYWTKIAYATHVHLADTVLIKHHDTVIAELHKDSVTLNNGGYNSNVTVSRLNKIARDNSLPIFVAIRNRSMVALDNDHKVIPGINFSNGATFNREV